MAAGMPVVAYRRFRRYRPAGGQPAHCSVASVSGNGKAAGMSGQDRFEHLLGSLHAAALDDGLWPAASGLIDEACGSKGNILVSGDGGFNGGVDLFFVRALYRGQRRAELEREYFEVYHPVDERMPRLRQLADSRIVHVDALFTGEEKTASPVYNEMMPRSDTGNCLHARLDGPHGSRIVWTVADPVDAEGWTSERVETVGRLLPHLRQFVRVREALVEARARSATIGGLLEAAGLAVILLDRSGGVAEANDRAWAILRRCDGLRDEDGRLRAALPEEDDALQGLVARAVPYGGGAGAGGSMTVSRERAASRLLLHASPVGAAGTDGPRSGRIGALVLAIDPADRLRLDPDALGRVLGLTPAESHIAASLVEGMSVHDIAAETGRSVITVKWHLRHIFAKHRLSRQSDLVGLAMSIANIPGIRR